MTPRADSAQVLRLDKAWNLAYERHQRAELADILAEDFIGFIPSGEPINKAALMVNPPERAKSVTFTEQSVHIFGETAVSRGRLQLELDDRQIDQRFLRVFAKRAGAWQAVSVSVTPLEGH
jgi:ketosteroid isomerase-like protein